MLDSHVLSVNMCGMNQHSDSTFLRHTDICLLLDYYGSLLTDRQRRLMTLYYADDWSLAEIADEEMCSRQSVHDVVRRGVERLVFIEKKMGMIARRKDVLTLIEAIRQALTTGDTHSALENLNRLVQVLDYIGG